MPGVPFEMKWIMSHEVIPRLLKTFPSPNFIQHLTFWVKNYTESGLAMYIEPFENELPDYIKLAYLPNSGLVRLRLTGKALDEGKLSEEMKTQRDKLFTFLGENIVSEEDNSLETVLHELLIRNNLSLGVAESCTGGRIASLFTSLPGSSNYFRGGVVSYSNEAKNEILGVDSRSIQEFGAVSREVVEQMALGAQKIFHADCAISTSGIAGPDGGTPDKPVGTVWIAVAYREQLISKRYQFSKNRENNILRASNASLLMLLSLLSR